MILDLLHRVELYQPVLPRLAAALAFLRRPDLADLAAGRHEIAGDDAYASVSHYRTKPAHQGNWEAHRRYVDLQCVLAGSERIGYAPLEQLVAGEYESERDFLPATGNGQFFTLAPGAFALLWPHDAHMPGIAAGDPGPVHKVVIKLAVR